MQGFLFGGLSLFAFWFAQTTLHSLTAGRTLCFMVLSLSQVFQSYNMRSHLSLFKIGVFTNHYLNKAALVSFALMAIVLFIPPLATIFGLTFLPFSYYLIGLGLSMSPILIIEIFKFFHILH